MSRSFTLDDVRPYLGSRARIVGRTDVVFSNVRPLDAADEESLVWLSPKHAARGRELLGKAPAVVAVVPENATLPEDFESRACVLFVEQPKLVMARIVAALFAPKRPEGGVHPTATVHPEAEIDRTAVIGPHCHVGRARLGPGVVLEGHVHVYDGVTLGARTTIAAHAVLGVEGFGFTGDEHGEWVHFPHIGGVILGEDVRVGAHACVVRGTLGDTVVESGTKLDNFVTIGHNARIGRRVLIASHAVIGGSAVVGDDVWISPHATVLNGIRVGKGAVVGAAATVATDVPEGGKLVARPAKLLPKAFWRMRTPLA